MPGVRAAMLLVVLALAATPQVSPPLRSPPQRVTCPVCKRRHTLREFVREYRGRHYFFDCGPCLRAFRRDPERFAAEMEPRSGLFRAPAPVVAARSLWAVGFGLWMLLALLCGGAAAYRAARRGGNPAAAFGVGFLGNLPGVLWVWGRPRRPVPPAPPGLPREARTAPPARCDHCGAPVHPDVRRCGRCGATRERRVATEAERALGGGA